MVETKLQFVISLFFLDRQSCFGHLRDKAGIGLLVVVGSHPDEHIDVVLPPHYTYSFKVSDYNF